MCKLFKPGEGPLYPWFLSRDANCEFHTSLNMTQFDDHRAVRTCNSYWNSQDSIRETGIEQFLMGMASQIAEREDMIITPDLRGTACSSLSRQ